MKPTTAMYNLTWGVFQFPFGSFQNLTLLKQIFRKKIRKGYDEQVKILTQYKVRC